jgi:L-prolyl-[peptidyl-carrier protein] dehydrogenase
MDFDLTPPQRKRTEQILSAVREKLPGSPRATPDPQISRDDWRTAASIGLTGLCLPPEFGGEGLGALDTALCLEAFGQACADTGLVFGVAAQLLACAVPVRDYATEATRTRFLPGLISGDLIAANAITEDDAGSDVGGMTTTATPDGDHYVLDGQKSFASNAPVADLLVTYAVTDRSAGFLGTTGFVVPRELPGVEVSPPLEKMGLHGCLAGRVTFSGCRVPVSGRLGREGQGGLIFQRSMNWERGCLFAIYLGLMERQLEMSVDHARRRRQFGRKIADFQAISHRIAVMAQRLASARLMLYRACWFIDEGREPGTEISMAKIAVSEAALANSLDAVQIFGGAGYLRAAGIEQQLRDCVPSTIFSGTTEIHRELIARGVGL